MRSIVTLALGAILVGLVAPGVAHAQKQLSAQDSALLGRLQSQLKAANEVGDNREVVRIGARMAELVGNGELLHQIGHLYERGAENVPADETEALRVFRIASDLGQRGAQYDVGIRYLDGRGLPRDSSTAVYLLERSAEQFYMPADSVLDLIEERSRASHRCAVAALERAGWKRLGGDLMGSMGGDERYVKIRSGTSMSSVRGDAVTVEGQSSYSRARPFDMTGITGFVGITERPIGDSGLNSRELTARTSPSAVGLRELDGVRRACVPASGT